MSGPGGVWSGGCLILGGVCSQGGLLPGGCGIPACTGADTPPVNRMTDRCKNITLATTSLRPVMNPIVKVASQTVKNSSIYL